MKSLKGCNSSKVDWGKVYRFYKPFGLNVAGKILPELAEDIYHQAIIKVMLHEKEFRGESLFKSYLYRVITNEAIMELRKAKGAQRKKERASMHINKILKTDTFWPRINEALDAKRHLRLIQGGKDFNLILDGALGFSNLDGARKIRTSLPAFKSRVFRARLAAEEKIRKNGTAGKALETYKRAIGFD
jgi:RNA polymerase sigma factor (sigma-70 family)